MKSLQKFKKKDIAVLLGIVPLTLRRKMHDPKEFTLAEIETLVKFGANRGELMNDIFGGKNEA